MGTMSILGTIIAAIIVVAILRRKSKSESVRKDRDVEDVKEAHVKIPVPIIRETITCPYCGAERVVGNGFIRNEIICDNPQCGKIIPVDQPLKNETSKDIRDVLFERYDKIHGNE